MIPMWSGFIRAWSESICPLTQDRHLSCFLCHFLLSSYYKESCYPCTFLLVHTMQFLCVLFIRNFIRAPSSLPNNGPISNNIYKASAMNRSFWCSVSSIRIWSKYSASFQNSYLKNPTPTKGVGISSEALGGEPHEMGINASGKKLRKLQRDPGLLQFHSHEGTAERYGRKPARSTSLIMTCFITSWSLTSSLQN